MATRFWVGGAGNWDASTTTHWAATSGGTGGVSVPGSGDTVTFDTLSNATAYTVTVTATANCSDLTIGNSLTGSITFAGSSSINVAGSLSVAASVIYTNSGTMTFTATSGTKTITTNGVSISSLIRFNGSGGTFQLADALTITAGNTSWDVAAGTFDPNGKLVTFNIPSGSPSLNIQGISNLSFASLTVNAAASVSSSFNSSVNGGAATITITGTLTLAGNSTVNRLFVTNLVNNGVAKTTLNAATVSTSYCDFRDITGAGAGSWNLASVTGGSGDCGGNSSITFTTPANQFWFKDTGNWSTIANWFLATNGGGGAGRIPLPQDSAFFDSHSFSAGSKTVTLDMPRMSALDFTGSTNTPTLAQSAASLWYGSVTLISGMSTSGSLGFNFNNNNTTVVLKTGTQSISGSCSMNCTSGTVQLGDNFTGTGNFSLTKGTFDANNKNFQCANFLSNNSNTRAITMGTGTWTLTGTSTAWDTTSTTGLTFTSTGNTLAFSGSSQTLNTNGLTFATVNFTAATPAVTISGGTFNASACTITGSGAVTCTNGGTNWNVTTLTANTSTVNFTIGSAASITSNGQSFYNLTINKTAGVAITLQDNLICTNTLTVTQGTLTANNKNVTCANFSSSNSNTRIITMGTGTWTLTGTGTVWDIGTTTGLTLTTTGSTIVVNDTSATAKTFAGNGKTYAAFTCSGDKVTVSGANTFTTIACNTAGLTNGLIFTASVIQIATAFTTNGSAGNLAKFVSSSAGTAATLSITTGTISVDYMSIKDSTASGGATFYAGANSTNVSGNTGWIFTAPPGGTVSFNTMLLMGV